MYLNNWIHYLFNILNIVYNRNIIRNTLKRYKIIREIIYKKLASLYKQFKTITFLDFLNF